MSDVKTIRDALRYPDTSDMQAAEAALWRLAGVLATCAGVLNAGADGLTGPHAEYARGLVKEAYGALGVNR